MREVAVSRVVGRSSAMGQSSGSGNRHSSSFNSRGQWRSSNSNSSGRGVTSRSSTRTRVDRVWVCKGCKAPKSDGWFFSLIVKLAIVAAALYFGANYLLKNVKIPNNIEVSGSSSAPVNLTSRKPKQSDIAPIKQRAPVVFAPQQEVVQSVEAGPSSYPSCSSTITDHCIDK